MNGYIYKVTICNKESSLDNHYYIGQKKGQVNKTAWYYGSGAIIKRYISKYGINSLHKEILIDNIKTVEELDDLEKYYIGDLYNTDRLCLNLKEGGINGKLGLYLSEKMQGEQNPNYGNLWTDEQKKKAREYRIKNPVKRIYRGLTDSEKIKMSISMKNSEKHIQKTRNSEFIKNRVEKVKKLNSLLTKEEFDKKFKKYGHENPNYNKKWTNKQKEEMSIKKIRPENRDILILDINSGEVKKYVEWVLLGYKTINLILKKPFLKYKNRLFVLFDSSLTVDSQIENYKKIIEDYKDKIKDNLRNSLKKTRMHNSMNVKYNNLYLKDIDTNEVYSFAEWGEILGEKPYSIIKGKCKTIHKRKIVVINNDNLEE